MFLVFFGAFLLFINEFYSVVILEEETDNMLNQNGPQTLYLFMGHHG